MRFLIDAQLPARLARALATAGHDAIHTSDLRLLVVAIGNITNDALMALLAANLDVLVAVFDDAAFIELGPAALVVHRQNPTKPE